MRFARHKEEAQRVAHLGIRGAARALASGSDARIEAGLKKLGLAPEAARLVAALPRGPREELVRLLRWARAPLTDEELTALVQGYRALRKKESRAGLGLNVIGSHWENVALVADKQVEGVDRGGHR